MQANNWLRKIMKKDYRPLNVKTSRFIDEFKMCLELGSTVLIENMGSEVPRKLFPIFQYFKARSFYDKFN